MFPSGTVLFKFTEFIVTNSCRNFYFKDSDCTFDIFKLFLLTKICFAASFFNLMLITGTFRSFGIIYAELLETYNVGAGYTAIILSIVIFLVAIGVCLIKRLDIYLNNTLYCRVRRVHRHRHGNKSCPCLCWSILLFLCYSYEAALISKTKH